MDKSINRLLAEIAIIGVGQHKYDKAELIASYLTDEENYTEIVVMIRVLSFMNRTHYKAALSLLEHYAETYEDLICFAIVCSDNLSLSEQKDYWIQRAAKSSSEPVRRYAAMF